MPSGASIQLKDGDISPDVSSKLASGRSIRSFVIRAGRMGSG